MHFGAQRLEPLLVAHAETVLLVHDQQAEPARARVGMQQLVRGDQDVDAALLEVRQHRSRAAAAAKARQRLDAHRPVGEAVAKALRVLLGEQRGGHQHHDLFSGLHGDEGRAHRHLGLAEADVAADDAIHRRGPGKVGEHARDRLRLVRRLLERECIGEGLVLEFPGLQHRCRVRRAPRMEIEQLRRHVAHGIGRAAARARPLLGAELVKRCGLRAAAGVAVDEVQRVHGHVQAVAVPVFEHQEFTRLAADRHDLESTIAADAVLGVHHGRARLEALQVAQDGSRICAGASAPPLLARPRSKQLALGQQDQRRVAQAEAADLRRDQDREPRLAVHELAPVGQPGAAVGRGRRASG